MDEQNATNVKVGGSNPLGGTNIKKLKIFLDLKNNSYICNIKILIKMKQIKRKHIKQT